jgi:hypothetical protein
LQHYCRRSQRISRSPESRGALNKSRQFVLRGQFTSIPRGIEHLPIAEEEAHILLLEPKTTLNTGDVVSARTVKDLHRV